MYLIIDNYDSFVHNLARYFALAGVEYDVVRNDKITIKEIKKRNPAAIILSPGPCSPDEAGICVEAIKQCGDKTPILGVCLGHQAIANAYGGTTQKSDTPIHGKSSLITHNKKGIFKSLPTPLQVGRYHSLAITLPPKSDLNTTAKLDDGTIMAMQHKTHPVYGVQFNPESILTQDGLQIIKNFVDIAAAWNKKKDSA